MSTANMENKKHYSKNNIATFKRTAVSKKKFSNHS